jgi:hypothetical protein
VRTPDKQRLVELLTEAGEAHHKFEEETLKRRDDDWAGWYARYLVEHGVADLLGTGADATALAASLEQFADAYAAEKPSDTWQEYYADRLGTSA